MIQVCTGWRRSLSGCEVGPLALVCCLFGLVFMVSAAHADRLGAMEPKLAIEPVPPPSSWQTRRDYSRLPVSTAIVLPQLAGHEAAARLEPGKRGAPLQIGFSRELPEAQRGDLARTVEWIELPGGSRVASFSVSSPGAASVRLGLRAELPDRAILRFFEPDRSDRRYPVFKWSDFVHKPRPPADASAESRRRTRWSPSIPGEVAGVEIELPPSGDPADVSLRVVAVSHIPQSPPEALRPGALAPKTAAACEPVRTACKSLPGCPNGAVARLVFTDGIGNTFLCTGTAVNSTRSNDDNFDNPFLLTANHCIGSPKLADSVETTWHYEHDSCGGAAIRRDAQTLVGGADLVTSDADTDSSLLRLRDPLPNGACLAAWDAGSDWTVGTGVFSLHHPGGEVREWASGSIEGTGWTPLDDGAVDFIGVVWTEGSTRGGSSGSGLFAQGDDGGDVLIGALVGGPEDDCTRDGYGRLDRFFANHAGVHLLPDSPPPADDHGDSADVATGVLIGSRTGGRIDDGTDADVFRVDILERGTLTAYTTGPLDTFGRLKREDGSTIHYDDDGGLDLNFRIDAQVEAGTYYVKVTGFDHTEVGAYRLHVDFRSEDASGRVLVPLFLAASALDADGRQGFVRVLNRSESGGEVRVSAIDDSGRRAGPVTLSIGRFETKSFNSQDLEQGNPGKGLSPGVGPGTGDWRLEFESDLDIQVSAYIRTADGFLASMHDLVVVEDRTGAHHVPVFNPASNTGQRSRLRLINSDPDNAVDVIVTGYDDDGSEGETNIEFRIPAGSVRTLDAVQLENGARDLVGRLGDGAGKWRLFVEASGGIHVVNLLDSVSGDLTNLSLPGGDNYSH